MTAKTWRRIVAALLWGISVQVATAGETRLAEPAPDWDNPRKIMLQLSSDDARKISGVFANAINLQAFYGRESAQIVIVAFGPGVRALLADSSVKDRVASLIDYDVEFVACRNTLKAIGKTPEDLLPGVGHVQAGIAEIIERKMTGWHYIVP